MRHKFTLALAVTATLCASGVASPALASTPDHGWDHYCGSQSSPGYGWYNVKAYNVPCKLARNRVAQHYKESGGDMHFNGWTCRRHQTGSEVSEINCTRTHDGRHQHVRFDFGS